MLRVKGGALGQAAEQVEQISQTVGRLAAEVPPACSAAAAAHSGWQFGRALSAAVPAWERHLHQQSSAVSATGVKLNKSAANYAQVENELTGQANEILIHLPS